MTRVWFPGWQFDAAVFEPLQQAMPEVEHINLDYAGGDGDWRDWIDRQHGTIPERAHLVGWSLGGMLAVATAMHRPDIASVTVLCANVRFAGGASGLDPAIAEDFRRRYRANPEQARQRFLALVQGGAKRQDLAECLLGGDQSATLDWLLQLVVAEAWLACPVRVLLARADALVPAAAAVEAWLGIGAEPTLLPGAHDLPWRSPAVVADWMQRRG